MPGAWLATQIRAVAEDPEQRSPALAGEAPPPGVLAALATGPRPEDELVEGFKLGFMVRTVPG